MVNENTTMITFPKYKNNISKILKDNKIYSLDSKKNTFKDEMRVLKYLKMDKVVTHFSDEEFDNILSKTLVNHKTMDDDVLDLIKLLRNRK